ncbi:DUF2155 domain-containing protein [Altericroceibacterium xinjiangense]|uniref:DUF2155 domain-containing protein n=1 Tax=Altericroceibacterium xinjiangense TaxID=762261 RepID=UPI0019D1EB52|nr:DUF2155 domain-containing protein [Altericroceibacterium xinjiangense]
MRALALLAPLLLAACAQEPPPPEPVETQVPEDLATQAPPPPQAAGDSVGTPLAERVATLGLLNKRNDLTQDIQLKPGESRRIGNVVIRLASCERTAPWENTPETGAFVQVFVNERASVRESLRWNKVFSGWLFKNSPSLNVLEHPIYDVWVKDCAMSFPGEEAPASSTTPE